MADFRSEMDTLLGQLDAARHAAEIGRLRACRSTRDMDEIVRTGGWLSASPQEPRLKLVKHGSGTWLVVQYVDGWSTRLAMHGFRSR